MNQRQLVGIAVVIAALGFVSTRFLKAASDNVEKARTNACLALNPDPVPTALQHREAPDFELPDVNGKMWSLKALRGHTVLLNFFATWCAPCVEEMAGMEDLARRMGDRAIILAVSVDEGWDDIKRFFARGTPLSVVHDKSKGGIPKLYGTEQYPETFLIDRSGQVRHYFINKRNWGQAEAALCLESVR